MSKFLIATTNKNKFREISFGLSKIPMTLVSLHSIQSKSPTVSESGSTFMENAYIKAKHWAKQSGLLTLSEDSGLEVEALHNKPGIYSHRLVDGDDKARCEKILSLLAKVPREKRTARFRSAVVIYDPKSDKSSSFEASCTGIITTEMIGTNGFGYDPIFYLPTVGKTMAQLSLKEKNQFGHRGRTLAKARQVLVTS